MRTMNASYPNSATFKPLEIHTFLAREFLVLCLIVSYGAHRLEVRLARAD